MGRRGCRQRLSSLCHTHGFISCSRNILRRRTTPLRAGLGDTQKGRCVHMTPHKELILGGQRSGKSARAERLAAEWLSRSPAHRAVYVATAQAHDEEMRLRIARHQQDRARRAPGMLTVESTDLGAQLNTHSRTGTAIVVDCLTLWLTSLLMPWQGTATPAAEAASRTDTLLQAICDCQAHLFIVSNEIGLGVIAPAPETRQFVDAIGQLNQRVAAVCSHVTFMAAGLPLPLKHPQETQS